MPTVPLVLPQVTRPSESANVRADPNMGAPIARAAQHIASGIQDVANVGAGIATKVKAAADTSYIIGAQTKLEATHRDFQTWTQDHPDTSTWDDEWKARSKSAVDDVQKGSNSLGTLAKVQLNTDVNSWTVRAGSEIGSMKQGQTIKNAIGTAEEGLNAAVANNDGAGASAIINSGLSHGLWNGSRAAAMTKRVTQGIASNVANGDIQADPFTAAGKLDAKNEAGEYVNYTGLPPAARVTMIFRANKLAAETRTATMRTWQEGVASARRDGTPMPDEDGVRTEAARQGIAPKWVDKLFKPVTTFDPGTYADLRGKIVGEYDPSKDTDGMNRAHLTQAVIEAHFPAQIQTEMLSDIEKKSDPNHVFNSPTFKQAMASNEFLFTHEAYGKYSRKVKDLKTGEYHTDINQATLRQAEAMKAHVTDGLVHFFQQNPKATVEESNKFMSDLYRGQTTKTGAALFKFNP